MQELKKKVIEKLNEAIEKPFEAELYEEKQQWIYALVHILNEIHNEPEYLFKERYFRQSAKIDKSKINEI